MRENKENKRKRERGLGESKRVREEGRKTERQMNEGGNGRVGSRVHGKGLKHRA